MNVKSILKRSMALGLTALIASSALGISVSAAGQTDPQYIEKNLDSITKEQQDKYLEVIKLIADGIAKHEESINVYSYKIPTSDFNGILYAIHARYPDLNYLFGSMSCSIINSYIYQFNPVYLYSKETSDRMLKEFYETADTYLKQTSGKLSKCNDDFSKALILHDAIVLENHYSYDTDYSNYTYMTSNAGVCQNYSEVYAYLLAQEGIYSEIVSSEEINHAWVKVKIDGSYYHVDATWDDPYPDRPGLAKHSFFLLSDQKIQTPIDNGDAHTGFKSLYSSGTKYDNYKYHGYNSRMCKLNAAETAVYAIDKTEKKLVKYNYVTDTASTVLSIDDVWYVNSNSYYEYAFSGLDSHNGLLYYNTPDIVYSLNPVTMEKKVVYRNTSSKHFYGLRISDNKLYVTLASTANETGTENMILQLPEEQEAADPVENKSTVSKTEFYVGDTVNIQGAATGGDGKYTYEFYYKRTTASNWTKFGNQSSAVFQPQSEGEFEIKTIASDSSGDSDVKTFSLKAKPALKNLTTVTKTNFTVGDTVTVKGAASGGSGNYQYEFYYKRSTVNSWTRFDKNGVGTFKPGSAGSFTIRTYVKDSAGKSSVKDFILTASYQALANNTIVSKTKFTVGESVTVKGAASGGSGTYHYEFYYRRSTVSNWTKFDKNGVGTFKPGSEGTFYIRTYAKDSAGKSAMKEFTLTAVPVLKNLTTVSKTSASKGETVTVKGAASGGSGSYYYEFYYKNSTGSTWTKFGSNSTASFKSSAAGTYNIRTYAKDSNGKGAVKDFTITVK